MKLLDLFCGAGGASRGYSRAGFHVTGVDIKRPSFYGGDEFRCVDAFDYLREHGREYDVIHASPPCQANSALTKGNRSRPGWIDEHKDVIPELRDRLDATNRPYIIENVQGSSLRRDLVLCGEMFGLAVIRHRYFELGWMDIKKPNHIPHRGRVAGMRHGVWYEGPYFAVYGLGGGKGTVSQWQKAMDINWTYDRRELAEAIPPAYTEYIGREMIANGVI